MKEANEQHLDKFDTKFSDITIEVSKIKNENLQLKEKEKTQKRKLKSLESDMEEVSTQLRSALRDREELTIQLAEFERDVKSLMEERERDRKEQEARGMLEIRSKEENKGVMLGDIQNMIKSYKDEKKMSKSGYISGGNGYSGNTSGIYKGKL